MKICLIGGNGSIARRYQAVFNYLKLDYAIYDINQEKNPEPKDFDRWLICTPTETHYEVCMQAIDYKIPFMVEKPLSKSIDECIKVRDAAIRARVPAYVVNNYYMIFREFEYDKTLNITYDYYNTGKDGLLWDCCQLIYRDPKAFINNKSPVWTLLLNYKNVDYRSIELSYIKMIDAWVKDDVRWLWDLDKAVNMTEKVIERVNNDVNRNTSKI